MNQNKQRAGLARAASLTPQRREEIAQKAAKARWEKKKAGTPPALDGGGLDVKPLEGNTSGSAARLRKKPI